MSFLDHIARCNAHDLSNFTMFEVDDRTVGHIRTDSLAYLDRFPDVFTRRADGIGLADGLADYDTRTRAVATVLRCLADEGVVTGWRGEPYPVGGDWGGPYAFEIERAAAPFFGCRAYGVHVNGFVRGDDGLKLWVATRAADRPVCPGELDNMIAGGQPIGLTLAENVVKEAAEEADVPAELAATARPVGAVSYSMEVENGLRRDVLYLYDLELPDDFKPRNTDGEIEGFVRWPAQRAVRVARETGEFKFNVNLVIIDFAIRHGLIDDSEPRYLRLLRGLHDWA